MKNSFKMGIAFLLILSLSGCVTSTMVNIDTNVEGAEVYYQGQLLGKSPVQAKITNAAWKDPSVIVKKEGYRDMQYTLEKEVQPFNTAVGCLLWWPSLLWMYGPAEYQYINLYEDK
ncbi:PEGA domain-containing protein [Spirochaeta cellobiosiphila]|uniref:PEGA domain-containing protein n=1 Tax=Spirochaeta cellobiosiphila TaxID=504483 RepID=UPI0003FCE782|nr:PEGA domain-containing protein [Spirochaeta cellobiosiphila]